MKRLVCLMVFTVIGLSVPASAENRIQEWSGHYQEGVHYDIHQVNKTVALYKGSDPNIPWRFVAYDTDTGQPGDIARIYIDRDPNDTLGVVRLRIQADPNHTCGARHVGEINLVDGSDASNTLEYLDMTGDAGDLDPAPEYAIYAHSGGTLYIGGTVHEAIRFTDDLTSLTIDSIFERALTVGGTLGYFEITYPNSLYENGSISVGEDANDIYIWGSLIGDVTVQGDLGVLYVYFYVWGESTVTVGGSLGIFDAHGFGGPIEVFGSVGEIYSELDFEIGPITIHGNCGSISARALFGRISIYGDLVDWIDGREAFTHTSEITIGGNVLGTDRGVSLHGNFTGSLTVAGDFGNGAAVYIDGTMSDPNGLTERGHIIFNSSFYGTEQAPTTVTIGEMAGTTTFFAVGYDGCDPNDVWGDYATVTVGEDTYYGNTPSARVWDVSPCVGDADGNGSVTLGDWTALYEAVDDWDEYVVTYAGLGGSICRVDTNCGGTVDPNDLDALGDWIGYCNSCLDGGRQQQEGYTAEEMAKALADATPPERYDLLLEGTAWLSEELAGERADYWKAVYDALDK